MVEVTDEEVIVVALAENLNRTDFTDYEKGLLFKKLRDDYGWSLQKIAKSMGKSSSFVSQHIAMLNLFDESSGLNAEKVKILHELSEGHARFIRRLPSEKDRLEVSRMVILGHFGVRETQRMVSRIINGKSRKSKSEITKRKTAELNAIVETIKLAYERESFSEIARLRHEKNFTLFDDVPPFERLNYKMSLRHTEHVSETMKNVRILTDGIDVSLFRNFAVVSFYLKVLFKVVREDISIDIKGVTGSFERV